MVDQSNTQLDTLQNVEKIIEGVLDNSKPWYQSKTVWSGVVGLAASGAGFIGIILTGSETSLLIDYLSTTATVITSAVAIYGRFKATTTITPVNTQPVLRKDV